MVARVRRKHKLDRRTMPKPYSGLMQRPQQNRPRGAYPQPTGATSVTTGPQDEQNSGGLLSNAIAGKQAVDAVGGMYEGGQDLREGFSGLSNAYDKTTNYLGDSWNNSMLGDATSGLSMPDFFSGSASQGSSVPLPSDFGMADGTINSLGGEFVGADSSFIGGDAGGLLGDSTGAAADGATTGLQGSGATLSQAMPYLNIGKDLIMGSDNLTGNQFGDAALRTGLAYGTGGLSELGYAVGGMFDWW